METHNLCFGAGGFLNKFLRSAILCVCLFVPFPSEQLIQLKRAVLHTPFHVGPRLMVLKGNAAHLHHPYSPHRGIFPFLLIPGWPWRGVFCTLPSSVPSTLHSLNPDHSFGFFPHRVIAQGEKVGSKTNSHDSRSLDSPGVARRRWQPLFLNALNYIVASAARLCIPNQTWGMDVLGVSSSKPWSGPDWSAEYETDEANRLMSERQPLNLKST